MDELVQVWSGGDTFEGRLLSARLEAEGISVLIKGALEGAYPVGPIYLFVKESERAQAVAVIDAMRSGAYAITDEDVLEGEPTEEQV